MKNLRGKNVINTLIVQGIGAIVYKSYISIAYEIYTIINIFISLCKNYNLSKKQSN